MKEKEHSADDERTTSPSPEKNANSISKAVFQWTFDLLKVPKLFLPFSTVRVTLPTRASANTYTTHPARFPTSPRTSRHPKHTSNIRGSWHHCGRPSRFPRGTLSWPEKPAMVRSLRGFQTRVLARRTMSWHGRLPTGSGALRFSLSDPIRHRLLHCASA